MTTRRPLVISGGIQFEMPAGDTVPSDTIDATAVVFYDDLDTDVSIYDLGPADSLLEAQCSANVSVNSGTVSAIPGLSFSFDSPGPSAEWKIESSLDLETQNTNSALLLVYPQIDTVDLGKNLCVANLPQPSRVPLNGHWKLTGVAAGSHTLRLVAQCTGSTNGYDVIGFHSRLFLHRVK